MMTITRRGLLARAAGLAAVALAGSFSKRHAAPASRTPASSPAADAVTPWNSPDLWTREVAADGLTESVNWWGTVPGMADWVATSDMAPPPFPYGVPLPRQGAAVARTESGSLWGTEPPLSDDLAAHDTALALPERPQWHDALGATMGLDGGETPPAYHGGDTGTYTVYMPGDVRYYEAARAGIAEWQIYDGERFHAVATVTAQREGNNYRGVSALRPAFKHYFLKANLAKLIERGTGQ